MCAGAHRSQKGVLDSLEWELWEVLSQQRAMRDISGRKCLVLDFAMFFLPTQFSDQGIIFSFKLLQDQHLCPPWRFSRYFPSNSFPGSLACLNPHPQGLLVPLVIAHVTISGIAILLTAPTFPSDSRE